MKYFLSFIFYAISFTSINSQHYFNERFNYQNKSITILNIYRLIDNYLVSFLFFDNNDKTSTGLMIYSSESFSFDYNEYYEFATCRNGIINSKNRIILYGKDRTQNNDLRTMLLDESFDVDWVQQYTSLGEWNFPTFSLELDGFIYGSYIDDFDNGAHREIGIKKIDTLGNEVWSKNYSQSDLLNYAWELEPSLDSNIFISARVVYTNKLGGYPQVIKIDPDGNEVWKFDSTEGIDNGGAPVWIAPLSNGNIVQSYIITGLDAPDIRLQWIDKDGKYIKRKLIDVPDKDEMYHNQLETGKGDYFFAYGTYKFTDFTSYGMITKYDNDGNIIWEHLYQHELFNAPNDRCSIKDIIELDNGDIVALGDLSHAGGRNERYGSSISMSKVVLVLKYVMIK